MSKSITIHKGRTNRIPVSLGINVSGDTLTSQIRTDADQSSDLIATFQVTFATDGVDGEVILTLDDSAFNAGMLSRSTGYMDIKRLTGGEPVSVFAEPLEVFFQGTVTA
jgi:hypothetical protein